MIAVISPAKTLDYESPCPPLEASQPEFLGDAGELAALLRGKSQGQLAALMDISPALAEVNHARYQEWRRPFSEDNARPALLAFKGDVYTGFSLERYGKRDFAFAQKHLRILSGLYGLLRPLDLMQPYRLEMGTSLPNARGKDLYSFWGDKITLALNQALRSSGSRVLVNLASQEYYSSIQAGTLDAEVITPVFQDLKNGKYKVISFHAKKARGLMCDHLVRRRARKPEDLKTFDAAGYVHRPELSDKNTWIFTRDAPVAA